MVKKTYIIVQARMKSERLPGKVLMKIDGKPLIGILFERLSQSDIPIIMATSTNQENDFLVNYAKRVGIETFRGSEDNVLERYYLAAKKYNAEIIIRVTADNPLLDGEFMKETIKELGDINSRTYFSPGKSKTYPLGFSFEVFPLELLEEAYYNATKPNEKEHVTPYMHQNIPGNIHISTIHRSENKSDYRLTVDTKKDFELMKILIEQFNCYNKNIDEIIHILDNNPQLVSINKNIKQKNWK